MSMALDICKRAIKEVTCYNNNIWCGIDFLINIIPILIPRSHVKWRRPNFDQYKLNIDAAGPNDVGSSGLFAVVRNSDGVVGRNLLVSSDPP